MKKNKLKAFIAVGLVAVIGLGTFIVTSCKDNSNQDAGEEADISEETVSYASYLTGETAEDGFDESSLSQRIVAFVVENTPDARPQWGLDDPDYSPDIVLQGEVEGGITRTLWFYQDYNKLPEIIGPMRSARPPFIKFSELFDAVFIHWGQSASKGEYIGANTVFKEDKVDHINEMTFNDTVGLYDRDHTRSTAIEHRGILYGSKVPAALESKGMRMNPKKEFTRLSFSALPWLTSFEPAREIRVRYSDRASTQNTYWTYNEEDQKYHTNSFDNDFSRDNLLILYDDTEYVTKYNYKGSGSSVTYCNYALGGGKGLLMSKGTVKEIEWSVDGNKLILVDPLLTRLANERAAERAAASEDGSEGASEASSEGSSADDTAEPVVIQASLNKGKTWIGWVSSNNGGNIDIINE